MPQRHAAGELFLAPEGHEFQSVGVVDEAMWTYDNTPALPGNYREATVEVVIRPNVEDLQALLTRQFHLADWQQRLFGVRIEHRGVQAPRNRRRPVALRDADANFLPLQDTPRYPKRVDQARERRRYTELQRRDRRRRREGRPPIGPEGPVIRQFQFQQMQLQPLEGALRMVSGAFRNLEDAVTRHHEAVRQFAAGAAQPAPSFQDTVERVREWAQGGYIRPPGSLPGDAVPVRVSPGAAYVPADAVRRLGPDLFARIGGITPGRVFGIGRDITHRDRLLGEGALQRDETSSVHSLDSSGGGAVWSDLISRIDELVDEPNPAEGDVARRRRGRAG